MKIKGLKSALSLMLLASYLGFICIFLVADGASALLVLPGGALLRLLATDSGLNGFLRGLLGALWLLGVGCLCYGISEVKLFRWDLWVQIVGCGYLLSDFVLTLLGVPFVARNHSYGYVCFALCVDLLLLLALLLVPFSNRKPQEKEEKRRCLGRMLSLFGGIVLLAAATLLFSGVL